MRLIRADNSKVIHQVGLSALSEHEISCLGWGINLTGVANERRRIPALPDLFLDDSKETDVSPDALLDLPRELALLDIESSLPRLSVLPSLGKELVLSSCYPWISDGVRNDSDDPTAVKMLSVLAHQSTLCFMLRGELQMRLSLYS